MRFLSVTSALVLGVVLVIFPFVASADDVVEDTGPPPLGVKPPLSQGLHVDLNLGGFFTYNIDHVGIGRSVSNAQPFVGLALGYDMTRNIIGGFGFGIGGSAGACYGPDLSTGECLGARNFSVTMLNAHLGYLHGFGHQWYLGLKVLGGAAIMTPQPTGTNSALLFGYNAGGAITTEYHTHLERFVLGLDIAATFIMSVDGAQFPGFAIYPRLKYVF